MSSYDECKECRGAGFHVCTACLCVSCSGSGSVDEECTTCDNGGFRCEPCDGSGEVLADGGLLFRKRETCPGCAGKGVVPCPTCHGKKTVTEPCPDCRGTRYNAECPQCGAKKRIECATCSGKGRVPNAWLGSLSGMPLERLRYEYEKRKAMVADLRSQVSEAHANRADIRARQEAERAEAEARGGHALKNFFSQPNYLDDHVENLLSSLDQEISELKAEMAALDAEIARKWT